MYAAECMLSLVLCRLIISYNAFPRMPQQGTLSDFSNMWEGYPHGGIPAFTKAFFLVSLAYAPSSPNTRTVANCRHSSSSRTDCTV